MTVFPVIFFLLKLRLPAGCTQDLMSPELLLTSHYGPLPLSQELSFSNSGNCLTNLTTHCLAFVSVSLKSMSLISRELVFQLAFCLVFYEFQFFPLEKLATGGKKKLFPPEFFWIFLGLHTST